MTIDEIPSNPRLAVLRNFLVEHGCTVNTHNAHGEYLDITFPDGKVALVEEASA